MSERDRADCTRRCRCQDPTGRIWMYLNAFCLYRDNHLSRVEDYGYPQTSIVTSAAEYARAWLAGEYNDSIAPECRPGYRPERT